MLKIRRFRLDLRVQIALLGVGGVLLLGTIFASASRTQAYYQDAADWSAALQSDVTAVATDLLGARQAETEFLLRRQEAPIARRIYTKAKPTYHPVAQAAIEKILGS